MDYFFALLKNLHAHTIFMQI